MKVWLSVLSPSGSLPDMHADHRGIRSAVRFAELTTGGAIPPDAHGDRPVSKPPLLTICKLARGVTALDGDDAGPVPRGWRRSR